MTQILCDLIRRHRWLFAAWFLGFGAIAVIPRDAVPEMFLAISVLYGTFGLFFLEFSFRTIPVHIVLPAGRATLGRAYWAVVMVLFPSYGLLLYGVLWPVHTFVLRHTIAGPDVILSCGLLCMGFAGGMLLLQLALSKPGTRGIGSFIRSALMFALGGPLVGLMLFFIVRIGNPGWTQPVEPTSPAHAVLVALNRWVGPCEARLDGPNFTALGVAIALIAVSWIFSSRLPALFLGHVMIDRRDFRASSKIGTVRFSARWRGLLWPWAEELGWLSAAFLLVVLGLTLTLSFVLTLALDFTVSDGFGEQARAFVAGFLGEVSRPAIWIVILLPGFFGVAFSWLTDLRGLRALPVSPHRLAVLLLSLPVVAFLFSLVILAISVLPWFGLGRFTLFFGWCTVTLSLACLSCLIFARFGVGIAGFFLLFWMGVLPVLDISLPRIMSSMTPAGAFLLSVVLPALTLAMVLPLSYTRLVVQIQRRHSLYRR